MEGKGHPRRARQESLSISLRREVTSCLQQSSEESRNRLLPFTCAQDYLRNIKKMLRLAGINRQVTVINSLTREEEQHPIWEVASSHMARRVLVGNLYKEL